MTTCVYQEVGKHLARNAIQGAEREINEEYRNLLRDKETIADVMTKHTITDAFVELEQEEGGAAQLEPMFVGDREGAAYATDVAYTDTAHKLALAAISEATTELKAERARRLQVIAELDWATLDRRVKEIADREKEELKRNRDGMAASAGGMECTLPNSISDSVIDTKPWRRYVTVDMGDVIVRAHSDVVNFYISPRDTPTPADICVSRTGSDVSTLVSAQRSDQQISAVSPEVQAGVEKIVQTSQVVMETNTNVKKGKRGKKKGLTARCRKFLSNVFCCRGQKDED